MAASLLERVMGIEASLRSVASQPCAFYVPFAPPAAYRKSWTMFDSHLIFIIITIKKAAKMAASLLERVMGIEPTRPAWKAGILAIELHPRFNARIYYQK